MSNDRRDETKSGEPTAQTAATADFELKRDATIRIAVHLARSDGRSDALDDAASPRSAFWNTLHSPHSTDPPSSEQAPNDRARSHESGFKRNFGEGLRNALMRNRDSRENESRRTVHERSPEGGIAFWLRVGQVDYASLSFGLVVTGAARFLEFFDGDIDLCEAVVESLVPESLVWASAIGKYTSNEEAIDRIGSVEVDASSLKAFLPDPLRAPPPAAPTSDSPKPDGPKPGGARLEATQLEAARLEATRLEAVRLEATQLEAARLEAAKREATSAARRELSPGEERRLRAWRTMNSGTLLVPVLLALGVLCAAFAFLRDEKALLGTQMDALTMRTQEALSQERGALKEERAAIDARLDREVDREVERASFWAQLGEELSKQAAARPVERKVTQPVVVGAIQTAAADTKPGAAPHP